MEIEFKKFEKQLTQCFIKIFKIMLKLCMVTFKICLFLNKKFKICLFLNIVQNVYYFRLKQVFFSEPQSVISSMNHAIDIKSRRIVERLILHCPVQQTEQSFRLTKTYCNLTKSSIDSKKKHGHCVFKFKLNKVSVRIFIDILKHLKKNC